MVSVVMTNQDRNAIMEGSGVENSLPMVAREQRVEGEAGDKNTSF